VVSFPRHSRRAFLVFLEYSLTIISEAWRAEKNLKADSDSTHQNKQESLNIFNTQKLLGSDIIKRVSRWSILETLAVILLIFYSRIELLNSYKMLLRIHKPEIKDFSQVCRLPNPLTDNILSVFINCNCQYNLKNNWTKTKTDFFLRRKKC
jgi:hypothetical protein